MPLTILPKIIKASVARFKPEDVHLTRFLQYTSISALRLRDRLGDGPVASISGSERLCFKMGVDKDRIENLDHPQFDVRSLPHSDSHFVACVADQVLEHIDTEPSSVFREVSRVLRPSGVFVNATVMTYPLHYGPRDMWRFTPDGLRYLFESAGFEVIHSGSWGGVRAVQLLTLGLGALQVPKWERHPVRRIASNPGDKWPIVVWCVGVNNKDSE